MPPPTTSVVSNEFPYSPSNVWSKAWRKTFFEGEGERKIEKEKERKGEINEEERERERKRE